MNENLFASFITPMITGLPVVILIIIFPSMLFLNQSAGESASLSPSLPTYHISKQRNKNIMWQTNKFRLFIT